MKLAEIMTPVVHTCSPSNSMNRAAQIMWEHDCGCVPVVDSNGRAIAMITDRDVCMAAFTQDQPLTRLPVSHAASRGLFSVRESDDVDTVEGLMSRRRIRRVLVVDDEDRPTGIVSVSDLARRAHAPGTKKDSLTYESVAATLAAICNPASSTSSAAE